MLKILINIEILLLTILSGHMIDLPPMKRDTLGNFKNLFRADDEKYADQQQVF